MDKQQQRGVCGKPRKLGINPQMEANRCLTIYKGLVGAWTTMVSSSAQNSHQTTEEANNAREDFIT